MHPLEADCLVHGLLYFITIPSMYLLLIIYSLFNLHDVSWGTRENPIVASQEEEPAAVVVTNKKKKGAKGKIMAGIKNMTGRDGGDEIDLSAAGLCRLACCFSARQKDAEEKVALIEMQKSLESLTKHLGLDKHGHAKLTKENSNQDRQRSVRLEVPQSDKKHKGGMDSDSDEEYRDNSINPLWLKDDALERVDAQTDFLSKFEIEFWDGLIHEYLTPLDEDKETKKRLQAQLMDLRNKVVGAFFGLNAVFVTAMFLLQMHKDFLYVIWPLGGEFTMHFEEVDNSVTVTEDYLHLEPLGILFIGFYAIVMVVQFIAMFCHRLATFSLIMVATSIRRGHENTDLIDKPSNAKMKETIRIMKNIQDIEPGGAEGTRVGPTGRMPVFTNLYKTRNERAQAQSTTLDKTLANKLNTIVHSPKQMDKLTKHVKDRAAAENELKRMSSMLQLRQTTNLETQA